MKRLWILSLGLLISGSAGAASLDITERRGLQEMVVSVKFLDRAINTYQDIAGWEVAYRGLAPSDQAHHWGLDGDVLIDQAVLRVPGTEKGYLRLVKFVDVPQVRIRSSARPFDTGAIFNFNTLVKDLDGVFESMRDLSPVRTSGTD